jgi:chromosome segregation ATPase
VTSIDTEREELEAAISQAEAAREYLEAALVEATAALVNTVTDAGKIDANWAEASVKVEKARARCRELRAALVKPGPSEFIRRSRERLDTLITQSDELSEQKATASAPSTILSEHVVQGANKKTQDESRPRKQIRRLKNELVNSPLTRQTVGLLSLVLSYLLYFHIDVQLQIISLQSPLFIPVAKAVG